MQITSRLLNPRTHTRGGSPLKLEKIWFFLRKIVIFDTKYPKNFRASLRSALIILSAPPPNLKSWIRPCIQTSSVGPSSHQFDTKMNIRSILINVSHFTCLYHCLPQSTRYPIKNPFVSKILKRFSLQVFHCEKRTLKVNDLESYRVL